MIAEQTGWQGLGVVPWFPKASQLPAEDALNLGGSSGSGTFKIACLVFSRIANFDDMDPLKLEPNVHLTMVRSGQPIPGDTDLVILPGTKSTRADLEAMRAEGWDIDLAAHIRRNGRVLGLCGGYQMLGRRITDPHGIEGTAGETLGLGHLDIETVMTPDKRLTRVTGRHASTDVALE